MMPIKELRELLKLLRQQGVLQYQSQELNLILTEAPSPQRASKKESDDFQDDEPDFQDLTPEQQYEYSATHPLEAEKEN